MRRGSGDEGPGLFVAKGWRLRDSHDRSRILVTLHVDAGSFQRVAGLYRDEHEAAQALAGFGDFEWLW